MNKLIRGTVHLYIPILVFVLITGLGYFLFKNSKGDLNSTENLPSLSVNSPTPTSFTTAVEHSTPVPSQGAKDNCVISGCSSEICAEEEKFSTCELKPEAICYKTATCEIQENGNCGWTQTPELTSCLNKY